MVFSLIGGDARSGLLARRLAEDGHTVRCYALESATPPHLCAPSLQEAMDGTQAVVLPIPTAQGSRLRTPFSAEALSMEALTAALPPGVPVFCGAATQALVTDCRRGNNPLTDLLAYEPFNIENAALTARAALHFLEQVQPHSLRKLTVLILGGGRIGKLLGLQLTRQGAAVTVAARSPEDRAWCRALGLPTEDLTALPRLLPTALLVLNTIPAPILTAELLQLLPPWAVLAELASPPGGFTSAAAEAQGHRVLDGRGLPGRYLAQEAADLIADTLYELIKVR